MKKRITIVILILLLNSIVAIAESAATLYKSPNCGCCVKYVQYLKQNSFTVKSIDRGDMSDIKKYYGSSRIASCHTTLINGYVIEGHVPVDAIHKLFKEKPEIIGISAPGMPMNSPGMGEMKKGTLTIYRIPKAGEKPTIFSVE